MIKFQIPILIFHFLFSCYVSLTFAHLLIHFSFSHSLLFLFSSFSSFSSSPLLPYSFLFFMSEEIRIQIIKSQYSFLFVLLCFGTFCIYSFAILIFYFPFPISHFYYCFFVWSLFILAIIVCGSWLVALGLLVFGCCYFFDLIFLIVFYFYFFGFFWLWFFGCGFWLVAFGMLLLACGLLFALVYSKSIYKSYLLLSLAISWYNQLVFIYAFILVN